MIQPLYPHYIRNGPSILSTSPSWFHYAGFHQLHFFQSPGNTWRWANSIIFSSLCESMGISGSDLLEVPTIYKAYLSGLCKGISQQNMVLYYMVQYLHFRILKFPFCEFSVSRIASEFLEFSPKNSQTWSVVHFERYGRHWTLCSPRSKVGGWHQIVF